MMMSRHLAADLVPYPPARGARPAVAIRFMFKLLQLPDLNNKQTKNKQISKLPTNSGVDGERVAKGGVSTESLRKAFLSPSSTS